MLDKNRYTRPGTKRKKTLGIVVHWVANPGTTARQNYNYFSNLTDRYASYNTLVDDTEIIELMPHDEVSWNCGANQYNPGIVEKFGSNPNYTTVSIGFCHPDKTGRPLRSTVNHLERMLVFYCITYKLDPLKAIYRHFDITGKDCPRWYVDDLVAWDDLKQRVKERIKINRKYNDMGVL